ncbi:ribonuclease H family protein [Ureibacillus thermosphaericus]|jgi:ribonuclease HII|uniref:Ribonuclease n=1 Tax=Ureibacillus thermosphaericus TaxID=51173 RepID=A0A840PQ97_URETH|nr:hypothetical protein [Ureibacillus thermosphaericus]MBB5148669.1 ribonuclease HII [Ureibacillus thermosphaericus]NKZ31385.1 hypothetical protein [Ureibacillus thermosphaericus]
MSNKIKLIDGTELDIVKVDGERTFYQNANRDTLKFVFDKNKYDLNSIDSIFSDINKIQTITILLQQETINPGTGEIDIITSEYIYNDYVLKMSISSETIVVEEGDSTKPPVTVERIVAKVAQQTYIEKMLSQLLGA